MTTTAPTTPDPRQLMAAPQEEHPVPSPTSLAHLAELIEWGQAHTVLLALPDMAGRWKGKPLAAGDFIDRLQADPAARWPLCAYVLATDERMTLYDDFALVSMESGLHDLLLAPVEGTVRLLPWRQETALVVADAVRPGERPIAVAPRQMLREQVRLLSEHGLTVTVGLEAEFTLYRGTEDEIASSGGLDPIVSGSLDLALDHPPHVAAYMQLLRDGLSEALIPARTIQTEHGPGQFEVTFPPGDPLAAADTHLVLQDATRHYARKGRMTALWMAAPTSDGATSGLHIHMSLHRTDGEPLPTTDGHRLPDLVQHAIAGLLDALPELAPFYAPGPNSYKRYRPDTGAPTAFTWGWDNRTCAVRVVDHGGDIHWEVRLAGADANPYLAQAAVLAAARHGIEHKLTLPRQYPGNAYSDDLQAQPMPRTLAEAVAAFHTSALPGRLFTERVAEHYAIAAAHTLETHHRTVTDFELRHALGS